MTTLYELRTGGRMSWWRVGVFSSVDKAKEAAAWLINTWHEFDGDDDVEATDYDAEWTMQRETIGRGDFEVGEPKPFLIYGSEGSAFKIDTVVLDVAKNSVGEVFSLESEPVATEQAVSHYLTNLEKSGPSPEVQRVIDQIRAEQG